MRRILGILFLLVFLKPGLWAQVLSVSALSTDAPIVHATGGEVSLEITSKGSWSHQVRNLSDQEGWIHVDASGSRITITTDRNLSDEDRKAVIMVTDGEKTLEIPVTQRQNIFHRKKVLDKDIRLAVKLVQQNNYWVKMLAALPVPSSSQYQDIRDLSTGRDTIRYSQPTDMPYIARYWDKDFPRTQTSEILQEKFHVTTYAVTCNLGRITAIVPYDSKSELYKAYTGKDGVYVDPTNNRIRSISARLWKEAGGSPLVYARLCYLYVSENFKYLNPYTSLHPLTQILQEGGGDCGNLTSIFVSLLRCQGIPARHIVMLVEERQYHIRAEFYMAGYGWIPVDVTYKRTYPGMDFFGKTQGQEIVVSQGVYLPLDIEPGRQDHAPLLQTQFVRYAYQGKKGFISFQHVFEKE